MVATTRPAVPSAVSDRKRLANQLNAQKSTGPTSDAGKARCAQNARKYGIFCKELLVPGEDHAELEGFKRDMLLSLNPRTALELRFVEQIIADEWRIKRVRLAERAAFERLQNTDRYQFEKRLADVRGKREQMETAIARAFNPDSKYSQRYPQFREEYVRLTQEWTKARETDPTFVPASTGQLFDRIMNDGDELERLQKYEQKLRNSVNRSLKELRQLRAEQPLADLTELTVCILNENQDQEQAEEEIKATEAASDGGEKGCASPPPAPTAPDQPAPSAFSPASRDLPPRHDENPPTTPVIRA